MAVDVWFQNAQRELLVTEICNLVIRLAGSHTQLDYVDVIRSYFDSAILELEYGCYIYPNSDYHNALFHSCLRWIYKYRYGEDIL